MDNASFDCFIDTRIPPIPKALREYGLWTFRPHCMTVEEEKKIFFPHPFSGCPRRKFAFYTISHLVKGEGLALLENQPLRKMKEGDAVIVSPGVVNRYGGAGKNYYLEDTINFAGPIADSMKRAGILKDGIYPLGKIRKLFPICELTANASIESLFQASLRLQELLVEIHFEGGSRRYSPGGGELFEHLLHTISEYPGKNWTIPEMAEMCRITPVHLRRLFQEKTGMSPKLYTDNMKMRLAAERLTYTKESIRNIAVELGYPDPYHFSRRFKELLGGSPASFRKKVLPS